MEKHPFWHDIVALKDELEKSFMPSRGEGESSVVFANDRHVACLCFPGEENQRKTDGIESCGIWGCPGKCRCCECLQWRWLTQICTTCLSSTARALRHIDFPIVFLDEASMATEPLSLVPLMKGVSFTTYVADISHHTLPSSEITSNCHLSLPRMKAMLAVSELACSSGSSMSIVRHL
jgi:hypothetical protein